MVKIGHIRKVIFICLILLLIGAIPYLRAFYLTGNPFLQYSILHFTGDAKLPNMASNITNLVSNTNQLYNPKINFNILWEITTQTSKFLECKNGAAGLYCITLLPLTLISAFFIRNKQFLVLLFFSATSILLIFSQSAYLRYILPFILILFLCSGFLLNYFYSFKNSFFANIYLALLSIVLISNLFVIKLGGYYSEISLKVLLGDEERLSYIDDKLPIKNIVSIVNRINMPKKNVLLFSPPINTGLLADAIDLASYNSRAIIAFMRVNNLNDMKLFLNNEIIGFIIIDHNWRSQNFDVTEKLRLLERCASKIITINQIEILKYTN